jgi:hypothetical protein
MNKANLSVFFDLSHNRLCYYEDERSHTAELNEAFLFRITTLKRLIESFHENTTKISGKLMLKYRNWSVLWVLELERLQEFAGSDGSLLEGRANLISKEETESIINSCKRSK